MAAGCEAYLIDAIDTLDRVELEHALFEGRAAVIHPQMLQLSSIPDSLSSRLQPHNFCLTSAMPARKQAPLLSGPDREPGDFHR